MLMTTAFKLTMGRVVTHVKCIVTKYFAVTTTLSVIVSLFYLATAQRSGDLRLARSSSTSSSYSYGRLEIYINGQWGLRSLKSATMLEPLSLALY